MPPLTTISGLQKYWAALEKALFEPIPGETIVDRLKKRPWSCDQANVKKAWQDLTHPINLPVLENFAAGEMNATAREITTEALKVCRERAEKAKQNPQVTGTERKAVTKRTKRTT